jgi:hypothetical protein
VANMEVWLDRSELKWATNTPETIQFNKLVIKNGQKFVNLSSSKIMVAKEAFMEKQK